jgi:hypothetical protein
MSTPPTNTSERQTQKNLDGFEGMTVADVVALVQQNLASVRAIEARAQWIRERVSDLPSVYLNLLPETSDTSTLAAAEAQARDQFRQDTLAYLKNLNQTQFAEAAAAPLGNRVAQDSASAATSAASDTVDLSKLSPSELILMGLRENSSSGAAPGGVDANSSPAQLIHRGLSLLENR